MITSLCTFEMVKLVWFKCFRLYILILLQNFKQKTLKKQYCVPHHAADTRQSHHLWRFSLPSHCCRSVLKGSTSNSQNYWQYLFKEVINTLVNKHILKKKNPKNCISFFVVFFKYHRKTLKWNPEERWQIWEVSKKFGIIPVQVSSRL